ncbi:hypothetical protein ENSA7_56680 [Enhygromyxa salina]|uniref:LamG-like jellyroll fold domain-containing protein n=2 Tax=Enhygromyxa salina TaxID=215803 RepID=A0A2S9YA61_9BACT|nr:hypothetical protein ENSA7_56680 [Enhygromyxa salina]
MMWAAFACIGCAGEPSEVGEPEQFRAGPTDGLELHWTFEDRIGDQVLDISGKGRHGWLLGGGSFVASSNGEAVSLDGVDDYIAFVGPRDPSLYGGVDGDFTINARVRVSDVARYNTLCFGCGPFSTMFVGTETYGARTMSALLDTSNNGSLWPWSTQSLANDTWVEVTVVVDGGVAARTYLDCTLDAEFFSPNIGLKNYGFSAVGRGSLASRWYQGEIDELRVWNRALTEAEIATICPTPATLCDGPIHVDVDAPGDGDGTTWASAFNDLQAALDAALECQEPEIWVAEGTYAPNPASPVATITAPVAIYGGFAGDEVAFAQRDVDSHVTRLGADGWNARVVLVQASAASELEEVWIDGFHISGSNAGAIFLNGAFSGTPPITATLVNLDLSDNVVSDYGAALRVSGRSVVDVIDSRFEGNSGLHGGGIYFTAGNEQDVASGELNVTNCGFGGNHGKFGGAIYASNTSAGDELVAIIDSTFTDNTATWGGAVALDDYPGTPNPIALTIEGGEFIGNTAIHGGGAISSEETLATIEGTAFVDNAAGFGGAIHIDNIHPATELPGWEIRDARFIANHATVTGGGAMLLEEHEVEIVNTEFVGNTAVGGGGGIFGRATVVASTFTGNTGSVGGAVYAPAGPLVAMRHIVAWPDTVVGNDIMLDHSCVAPTANDDTVEPFVILDGDPFEPADLDLDGRTEYYLASDSACRDFAGIAGELDWESLTTQVSQCTDVAPTDAGVHYVPLFDAGPCVGEGGDDDTTSGGDTDSGSTSGDGDGDSSSSSSSGDGDGDGDGGGDATGDGDGDGDTTGDGGTTGDGDGDGDCGEWSAVKTRALGLDRVWTDGVDLVAVSNIRSSADMVRLADGQWTDIEATTNDRMLAQSYDVWGSAVDDQWVLGFATSYGKGVFHHDGVMLDSSVLFPAPPANLFGEVVPQSLAGSGPDDVWATAWLDCGTMACEDPDCSCNGEPSLLMHYDGVEWSDVASPGLITQIWTDGTSTWGVGGRDQSDTPWLTPVEGVLASFDGADWTIEAVELPPLRTLWSLDGGDVWVGGNEGTLRRYDGLDWEIHDLPTVAKVVKIEGRSNTEIWALDDEGELWAYDSVGWNAWLSLPHARDFVVMDDLLAVVGDDDGHLVEFVDIENETVDIVYWRRNFQPQTLVADNLDSAIASSSHEGYSSAYAPNGSYEWDGVSWSPTYLAQLSGFDRLVGAVDQGFATRQLLSGEVDPDFHPIYEIIDGEPTELAPPAPDLDVTTAEVFTLDGQAQLWVATATLDDSQYRLYARVGGVWVDRQPPGLTLQGLHMTQGGQRVFVNFNGAGSNVTWMFEAGIWTDISNPLNNSRAISLASTGKFQLWMTASTGQASSNPEQLYFWGGGGWNVAKNLFPQIAGYDQWSALSARAPNDMWMMSSRSFEPENLAHWNGQVWTVLDTPALLHGWARVQDMLEPVPGGVFISDGIRLWRHEVCAP